jgi:hypothetical protein
MSSDGYELLCLENPLLDILGTENLTQIYTMQRTDTNLP